MGEIVISLSSLFIVLITGYIDLPNDSKSRATLGRPARNAKTYSKDSTSLEGDLRREAEGARFLVLVRAEDPVRAGLDRDDLLVIEKIADV